MTVYRDIYEVIRDHQGRGTRNLRLIKIGEEVGEVMEAYLGLLGANKRKGFTHAKEDVAKELCDVIVTAHVALSDWTDEPELFMEGHLKGLLERIKKEGS